MDASDIEALARAVAAGSLTSHELAERLRAGNVRGVRTGVSVVNIDNGFGAAYQASLINHLPGKAA